MGRLLLWVLLTSITGSPVLSLLVLVVIWWTADRFTFRFLPDPVRAVRRRYRAGVLGGVLAANPHDRRSRLELAQLLLELRRPLRAVEVLRPNVEAGDDDVHTAFTLGAALARSGHREPAEQALAAARERDAHFRMGEIDLELGRLRLASGDAIGARQALERFLEERPGTVQGRWLLSRALLRTGDIAGAQRLRDEAWKEYRLLPRFQKRVERPWAWRAKPWRPVVYLAIAVVLGLAMASIVLPAVMGAGSGAHLVGPGH
jgi:tetratricopeptide (TPR) repeat protein